MDVENRKVDIQHKKVDIANEKVDIEGAEKIRNKKAFLGCNIQ